MKNSKKTIFMLEEGNTEKLTKERLKEIKDAYVKIGQKKFIAPDNVIGNKVALQKWIEIMKLYASCDHVDIVTSADIGLLERYVLLYADYQLLLDTKKEIREQYTSLVQVSLVSNAHKLDSKINSLAKILLTMESELFLTPLSKSRAMPRKKKTDLKDKLSEKGFKLK